MLNTIDAFLHFLKYGKSYSDHTISAYRRDLLDLAEFVQNKIKSNPKISDISRIFLKDYMRSLVHEKLSNKTYNRHLATIKSFSKYLLKNGFVSINLSLNLPSLRLDRSLPDFVPKIDMAKIIKNLSSDDFLKCRENLIIELFYDTGIRLSELVNLRLSDFNFFERMLSVVGKGRKQRIIPFSLHLPEKITTYVKLREKIMGEYGISHEYLFISNKGNKISNRQVQRIVASVLSKIATLTKTSPHILRHSCATHMLDSGADIVSVRTLLGHESLSTTQIYTHLSMEKLKSTYKKNHPKGGE